MPVSMNKNLIITLKAAGFTEEQIAEIQLKVGIGNRTPEQLRDDFLSAIDALPKDESSQQLIELAHSLAKSNGYFQKATKAAQQKLKRGQKRKRGPSAARIAFDKWIIEKQIDVKLGYKQIYAKAVEDGQERFFSQDSVKNYLRKLRK